ncbi:MAG: serine/threonine-protein kinase [Elusimicrobiota bacterium]
MKKQILDNRYLILKQIGLPGGFGTVYKARDIILEKLVAVKKLHEELSNDAKFLDMFRKEAIITASLEHENIVRVIDYRKTSDETYYIIMDYVKGNDLRHVLKRCVEKNKKLPVELSASIVAKVLSALDYAHALKNEAGEPYNIVHRDVSPGNIMLCFDGKVKLTDFGIAKAALKGTEKTRTGVLKGKIPYMSPEQAEGKIQLDKRSDIFSLGIILYELLTNKRLFEGDTDLDIWQKVRTCKFDLKPLEESKVPDDLKNIVLKALQKDLDKRYQLAKEMFIDIWKYVSIRKYGHREEDLRDSLVDLLAVEIQHEQEDAKLENIELDAIAEEAEKVETTEGIVIPSKEKVLPEKPPEKEKRKEIVIEHPEAPESREVKTVFDFVLDTAKKYRKIFVITSICLFVGLIFYCVADIYFQFTRFGIYLHQRIWPPTVIVKTIPPDALLTITSPSGEAIFKGITKSDCSLANFPFL